jgi:cytochrome b561
MLRRPRQRADTSNDHQEYLGEKRRGLTRTRQKLRHRCTLTPACSLPSDYSRESVRSNSQEQGRTDSGKRLSSIGIVIFTLAVFRLGWRLTHQPPPLPQSISKPQQTAAHSLHWVLYLLILVQPISGYVHRMAGAHLVSFFGLFNLPVLIGKNEPLRLLTDAIHDSGGIIIAILVAGHIGVALKHRFIDRDAVMQRMIP